jgi:hypothetical protein
VVANIMSNDSFNIMRMKQTQRVQMIQAIPTFPIAFYTCVLDYSMEKTPAADRGGAARIHGSQLASLSEVALCVWTETTSLEREGEAGFDLRPRVCADAEIKKKKNNTTGVKGKR